MIAHLELWCRVANVGLAVLTAAGFFIRVNDMWATYGPGGRALRVGLLLLLLSVSYGSAQLYLTHGPLAFRSVTTTVALLLCLVGLVLMSRDPDQR